MLILFVDVINDATEDMVFTSLILIAIHKGKGYDGSRYFEKHNQSEFKF